MNSEIDYLKLTKKEDFSDEVIKEMIEFFDRDEDHLTPICILWRAGFTFDDLKEMVHTKPNLGIDLIAIYDLEIAYFGELEYQMTQSEEINHEQNIQ